MGSQVRAASRCCDPGPIFGEVTPEIIEDTLIQLATENEQSLSELSDQAGCFKETQTVEFIFLLSEKWHLDQSARYQAVELLERFMIKQVEQVYKSSRENVKSCEQGQGSSWSSLKDQIYDTFVLRLVSCIQLASKLSLHYNIVNSDTALKFLQSLKYSYTKQELLESELAVLKSLHYQINVSTPLAYVELLLEVLGKSINRREWERIFKSVIVITDLNQNVSCYRFLHTVKARETFQAVQSFTFQMRTLSLIESDECCWGVTCDSFSKRI